jgi:hypothetical protein
MKRVGDIIFHNLGAQWKGTPSYCDFSGFFSIFFAARNSEAGTGGAEVGVHNMISMTIRELYQYCTFADFSKNWNFRWVPLHNIKLAKLRWAG